MPELVFTVARFGLLILLWVFVFVVARAIRRDVFAGGRGAVATPGAPSEPQANRQQPSGPSQPPAPPQPVRQLVVTEGDLRGTRIPLGSTVIRIGRAPDSTLVISDDFASGRHAQLAPQGGQWILEDLGSTNGTFLGRDKVTTPIPVPPGVPIRIGRTSIELHS